MYLKTGSCFFGFFPFLDHVTVLQSESFFSLPDDALLHAPPFCSFFGSFFFSAFHLKFGFGSVLKNFW